MAMFRVGILLSYRKFDPAVLCTHTEHNTYMFRLKFAFKRIALPKHRQISVKGFAVEYESLGRVWIGRVNRNQACSNFRHSFYVYLCLCIYNRTVLKKRINSNLPVHDIHPRVYSMWIYCTFIYVCCRSILTDVNSPLILVPHPPAPRIILEVEMYSPGCIVFDRSLG